MGDTHTQKPDAALVPADKEPHDWIIQAGRIANEKVREVILQRYLESCSYQTIRRHKAAIAIFEQYLEEARKKVEATRGLPPMQHMYEDLAQWAPITFGLVEGFREWMKKQGYAIGTINVRLDSVKMFCTLAMQADYLDSAEHARIYRVRKIRLSEGRNIDEKREKLGLLTRKEGSKKARPNLVDPLLHRKLKDALISEGSDLAIRDLLLVCFLADHGLREGEVAALPTDCIDLERGTFTFYRHKVHKTQTLWLSDDTVMAARLYFGRFPPRKNQKRLFEGDRRPVKVREDGHIYPGKKREDGYDETSIYVRIRELGRRYLTKTLSDSSQVPLDNLSPHDLRHSWATEQARKKGVSVKALQDAGGWSNPITPLGYIVSNEIANDELIDLPPTQPRSRRDS
jgi:integrase